MDRGRGDKVNVWEGSYGGGDRPLEGDVEIRRRRMVRMLMVCLGILVEAGRVVRQEKGIFLHQDQVFHDGSSGHCKWGFCNGQHGEADDA